MDYKTYLSQLSADAKADLTKRSNGAGLLHLAGHVGVLGICAVWIAQGWPFWAVVLPLYGTALVFLFTLEHECTHKTPFALDPLNEWVGRLCGVVLILPFEWFRYFHLAHHRHTNIPGKDPEIATPRPETWLQFIWYLSGLPYWGSMIRTTLRLARGQVDGDFVPDRAKPRVVREARILVGVYAIGLASLLVTPALVWLWIVPALIGQPVLRLYTLAEHGRCPQVADMFMNSRTTLTNRIVRFFAWNMPFHAEHHAYPSVPFHKLPELHEQVQDHLAVTTQGYRAFTAEYTRDL